MSLNKGEVNPLGVLKLRRLKFIPAHFTTVRIGPLVDIKFLTQWINYNLNSRYGIKQSVMIDQDNKIKEVIEIGLEDGREITLLLLGCPYINNNTKELF
jgi:hypothetical protein